MVRAEALIDLLLRIQQLQCVRPKVKVRIF